MILQKLGKVLFGAATSAVLVLGAITLSAPTAQAMPPILLCGPTLLWTCKAIGGPELLLPGTVCEIRLFERKSGYRCEPFKG